MGNRLSKIYTRTGDDGSTGLGDGTRIPKNAARVEAYGTVDELNSALGVLLAADLDDTLATLLTDVQQKLFDLGGELCIPDTQAITDADIEQLEVALDKLNADLPPLKDFVLPGGTPAAAACHLARAVCRRAERRLMTMQDDNWVNPAALRYLNRLSDLLFVVARTLNHIGGNQEILWTGGKLRDKNSE